MRATNLRRSGDAAWKARDMSDQQHTTELLRNLFPDLAQQLDRALEHSGAVDGTEGFEASLGDAVGVFQQRHAALAWHDVADEAARGAVLASFEAVHGVLRDSGFALPAPESFASIVDLDLFAERYHPGLAVVPAPHGIGLEGWQRLFELAAARQPHRLDAREPLIVASEAVREFGVLESQRAEPAVTGSAAGVRWSLRLVPAGPAPALLGLNYEHGPHVTMPEMLMLQLMRITSGEEPLDQASFTWIAGGLSGGKLAARHVYDAADLAVRVSCREIGNQGPHLGARAPIELVG